MKGFIPKRSQFFTDCLRIRNRHYLLQKLGQVRLAPKESISGVGGGCPKQLVLGAPMSSFGNNVKSFNFSILFGSTVYCIDKECIWLVSVWRFNLLC